jgi:hypothetical protein
MFVFITPRLIKTTACAIPAALLQPLFCACRFNGSGFALPLLHAWPGRVWEFFGGAVCVCFRVECCFDVGVVSEMLNLAAFIIISKLL